MVRRVTLFLRNGTRIDIGERSVTTRLANGAMIHAVPHGSAEQLETARQLGYGDDVDAMTRDHDPLHSLLADWFGLPASFAMRDAARELTTDYHRRLAQLEERAVLALQAYAVALGLRVVDIANGRRSGS